VIGIGFGADTPVNIVVLGGIISGFVSLIAVAEAPSTFPFSATVVVGNDISLAVSRVFAGTNPGDRRRFSARRAFGFATTTATAKVAIYSAIAPVVTILWVSDFRKLEPGFCRSSNG
jgi:hypothetical protein